MTKENVVIYQYMFDKIEIIRICAQKKTQNLNKKEMKRKLNKL